MPKKLEFKNRYTKSLKNYLHDKKKIKELTSVVTLLLEDKPLEPKHRKHKLSGNYSGLYECHIMPDFLLIWEEDGDRIILTDIGSHSDLF